MMWLFRQGMDTEVMPREYVWVPLGKHPLVRAFREEMVWSGT
jgi:hypothetical protein